MDFAKWTENDAIFYHIYPLGFCGAEEYSCDCHEVKERLYKIIESIPHLKSIGINAIYLGPLFESTSHGYDTKDYFNVDRRLGTNDTLKRLVIAMHEAGIRVILDGVFNHSGRDFFAFKDIQSKKNNSKYTDWYVNLNFNNNNCYNDNFSYEGWAGCMDLVKYNLHNQAVKEHLLDAVEFWIREFDIDGLRLDAADVIEFDFLRTLGHRAKSLKNNFWITGEVVHGDYSRWVNDAKLDSTTNYEVYKGLWSSFNDSNFFEIAHSLKRQFSNGGIYQNMPLYNFLDNHDVNRITSTLVNKNHLFPLYGLLFTIPGIPSIYYGSEFGIEGMRSNTSDKALRPCIDIESCKRESQFPDLIRVIKRFADCRLDSNALKRGDFVECHVSSKQYGFTREYQGEKLLVIINSDAEDSIINLSGKGLNHSGYDVLNSESISIDNLVVPANWLRIIKI